MCEKYRNYVMIEGGNVAGGSVVVRERGPRYLRPSETRNK